MKKTISVVLLCILVLSLCACGEHEMFGKEISRDEMLKIFRYYNSQEGILPYYSYTKTERPEKWDSRAILKVRVDKMYYTEYTLDKNTENSGREKYQTTYHMVWSECTLLEVVDAGEKMSQYLEQQDKLYFFDAFETQHIISHSEVDEVPYVSETNRYVSPDMFSISLFSGFKYEVCAELVTLSHSYFNEKGYTGITVPDGTTWLTTKVQWQKQLNVSDEERLQFLCEDYYGWSSTFLFETPLVRTNEMWQMIKENFRKGIYPEWE